MRALESILVEKGYVDPKALDVLIETYETKVGPHNGAKVVAKAWTDPNYKTRLLKDATAAIAEFGFTGRQGEHMVAVENTDKVHNIVVCTLCSCYPWTVLGLPPVWYKSAPYRSRAVSDPRSVLADFGVTLPGDKEIKVWDSTAEVRYLVVPERPARTDGWNEERLAALVTRDSMIGTGLPKSPGDTPMNGAHDMGGTMGFGPVVPEKNEPVFHAPWERRAFALTLAMGAGRWNIDQSRAAREQMQPGEYLAKTYYEIWIAGLEKLMAERGLVTADEIAAGKVLHAPKAVRRSCSPRTGWPWLFPKAGRRRARHQCHSVFRSATSCAPATSIPPATHAFRVTCADTRELSRTCTAFTFFRTPTPRAAARTRSGCTRFASLRESYGARQRTRRARSSVDAWESYLEPK